MVSSFVSQLQAIASKSSNELDLKARRNAHAESLLFEKDVAVKQDFETIYRICVEGFRELCQLDSRFHDFDRNLFAEQAKSQEREELSKSQNEALDLVIKRCLMLLGPRILLKPALKALEWLVRRFRIHIYNIDDLLHTLLPYHEVTVWANVLSIVPNDRVVGQWKVLRPYLKTTWNVPRHAIAYAVSHDDALFASMNSYALALCRQDLANAVYMTFWSGISTEAIATRLAQTRSGRKEVQSQRVQDLLLKVLPLLSEGYEIAGSTDLIITCYTITIVLAAKAELADHLLDSLLLAVCQTLQKPVGESSAALVTASVVMVHKATPKLPRKVLEILSNLKDFSSLIRRISEQQSCQHLLVASVASSMSQTKRKNAGNLTSFALESLHLLQDLYPATIVSDAMVPLASRLLDISSTRDSSVGVRNELIQLLQEVNKNPDLSVAFAKAVTLAELDSNTLENLLGMTVNLIEPKSHYLEDDTPMKDVSEMVEAPETSLDSMPSTWEEGSSFLTVSTSEIFRQVGRVFQMYSSDSESLEKFAKMPLWSSVTERELLWQSFLIRFACSTFSSQARQRSLQILVKELRAQPACEVQFFIPYAVMLLTDVKVIRRSASDFLHVLLDISSQKGQQISGKGFYSDEATQQISVLSHKQTLSLLDDVICPTLEECILDQGHIIKIFQSAMKAQTATDVKKSHRQAAFSLLTQHALATPLLRLKVCVISMLDKVPKVGGKSKTKVLLPLLQQWSQYPKTVVNELAQDSGLSVEAIDAAFVQLADLHDGQYLDQVALAATQPGSNTRTDLIQALFEHMRRDWNSWTADEHITSAETLFSIAFSTNETLSANAQDVLRNIELSSEVLAILLQHAEVGVSDVRGPPSKKKRRSSSGASQSRIDVVKTINTTTAKISFALELVDNNNPEGKSELITVMFEMLACLKQLQQNRVESPYLLNLCLSSIYAMIQNLVDRGTSADVSGVKPELVTECLRSSDNPQVQNSSLLVLAALSSVVPDRVVHNVMPIFTFIGHNMLSKDDEHSINVVNAAIDKIVPALLQSLRKSNNPQTYQSSMATMLANFTSAYEHIPRHRRVAFYQKLLFSVDADEFGFILVALLAAHEGKLDSFGKFLQDVSGALSPSTQLIVYHKLVDLSVDVLSISPKISSVIFNLSQATSAAGKISYAKSSLTAGIIILQSPALASEMSGEPQIGNNDAAQAADLLRISFETTLSAIQRHKDAEKDIQKLAKQSLDALLRLPKMADLIAMLHATLDDMEETQLRPQALRVLSVQLQAKHKKDSRAREQAFALVEKLNEYIHPKQNVALLQASLACINSIVEVYGRKNPEITFSVAENITRHGLMAFRNHPKVLEAAILMIASVVDVVKDGSVPLAASIVTQTLSVLSMSIDEKPNASLFGAICTLLSALFSSVAFIISQDQLAQILTTTFMAKENLKSSKEDPDFSLLTHTIAQKVDLEVLIEASIAVLEKQTNMREAVATISLSIVRQAIEITPKGSVIKQAEAVSRLFEIMLDIEADSVTDSNHSKTGEQAEGDLSSQLQDTSIKFIYKLNDTTFRPIFESWVDWSSPSNTGDTFNGGAQQTDRQIALFKLLIHFFENLKAIVTSYATYLLTTISTILKSASQMGASNKSSDTLVISALELLRTIATHDQDSFFAAPSNFDQIAEPLVSTLLLASTKSKRYVVSSHNIPAIIALATATVDSPNTHGTLVHFIVGLKAHTSARVRLASIQTLIALTEEEDLGDEFLANTIGIGVGEGEGARGGGSSVGEIMIYVNEMLEDDDDDVEREVRRWVQLVRAKVGEDVFEV